MTIPRRLAELADTVKDAGLRGESMTDTLHKVAQLHDLTVDEIDRVAETANRQVQLSLYKTAADKRFKFDLARPKEVKTAIRTTDKTPRKSAAFQAKYASAIDDSDGDPFGAPSRANVADKLSLVSSLDDATLAEARASKSASDTRLLAQELDSARLSLKAMQYEGQVVEAKIAADALRHHDKMVQDACDLVFSGITLPSLYEAIVAGSNDEETADSITRMILADFRRRRIPVYRLGFKARGNPADVENMTDDEIIDACKALSSVAASQSRVSMSETKTATIQTTEHVKYTPEKFNGAQVNMQLDAANFLATRESMGKVPKVYVDFADNYDHRGLPRIVDANNHFVMTVKDLVGEQTRLRKAHSANEYLGLKMQQVEEALAKLKVHA